jgi:hypothetical protein
MMMLTVPSLITNLLAARYIIGGVGQVSASDRPGFLEERSASIAEVILGLSLTLNLIFYRESIGIVGFSRCGPALR